MDYNSLYSYPPPRRRKAFQQHTGAGPSTAPRHDSIASGPSGAYGASPLAGRLQTPSLTSLTSATTTASMFTSTSAADSAYGGTTVRGYTGGTPPLIELDDDEMDASHGGHMPLALESGAGFTPTDKLRMLIQQMHGDARKPDPPTETLAPPPAYRIPAELADPPASPPRVEHTDDEYSPPTPPPRISNPYLYSRRAMERREVEEQSLGASPPRRLPSRAIALRAAAQARASNPEPASPPPRREPTALESFLASHPEPFPEPSSSRVRAESTPTRSRKGKERASSEEPAPRSPAPRSRYDEYDGEEQDEEQDLPSPPRRRRLAPRRDSIEPPPDSSTQFADGLRSVAADEYDLDEDNSVPWPEEDTLDSIDSGTGRRQRLLAAEERSHSRARDHVATTSTSSRSRTHSHSPSISFATAPSTRLHAHGTVPEADMSLPPIPEPEPESFEDEDRSLRRRAELLRPFSRETTAPLKRSSESLRRLAASEPEPEEPTRYDTARDSARFEALRSGMSATPSFKDARSSVGRTFREVDDVRPRDVQSSTLRRKESSREVANGSLRDTDEVPHEREQEMERQDYRERSERVSTSVARQSVTREYSRSSMEGSRESLRVSSSPRDRRQASKSPSPASPHDESDIVPAGPNERHVVSPSASRAQLGDSSRSLPRSNVRWSPQVEKRVFRRDPEPEELEEHGEEATELSETDALPLDEMEESAGFEEDSWQPETQFDRTPSPAPTPVRRSPEQERRPAQRTSPQEERRTARVADVARSQTGVAISHSRTEDASRRERHGGNVPSTPSPVPASTSPQSSPPTQRTPAGRTRSRPTPAAEPSTPAPSFPATPAHLKGVKTPHPPGAWGTPLPPRPAAPGSVAFSPLAPLEEAVPVTPKPKPAPDYASMATPKPPGAWRTPAPSSTPDTSEVSDLPATPSPQGNATLSGMPTPRPPGAWQNTPQHLRPAHQRSIPARFSSLRNEVLPDSSVSSAGSSDVSFHRIRSPKRSPHKEAPALDEPVVSPKTTLLTPVLRSPKRSPVWSPSSRAAPSTPTKSSSALVDDSFDLDRSWTGRIHRLVLSPLRPLRPSTALNDAQAELATASRASEEARDRVAAAQQAWLDALAAVPSDVSPPFAVARSGWTWSVFLFWASLELLLLWVVFRVTLDYATSSSLLSRLDPWHPQLASYAVNVPVPAGLQAFATQRATPANLFDLLDMLGFGGGGQAQVWRAPT